MSWAATLAVNQSRTERLGVFWRRRASTSAVTAARPPRRVVIHAAVFEELEYRQIAYSHPLSVSRIVIGTQSAAVTRPALAMPSARRPGRRYSVGLDIAVRATPAR